MAIEPMSVIWRIVIGAVLSVILTGISGVLGWMVLAGQEVDRTQEGVLKVLEHLKEENHGLKNDVDKIRTELKMLPRTVDDGDRWRRNEELIYQEMIEGRLSRLERFHAPYSNQSRFINRFSALGNPAPRNRQF